MGENRRRVYISTHAPRAGSDPTYIPPLKKSDISTHAPRAGSDIDSLDAMEYAYISTHAPRAGSDDYQIFKRIERDYFNPRSPCGERQQALTNSKH